MMSNVDERLLNAIKNHIDDGYEPRALGELDEEDGRSAWSRNDSDNEDDDAVSSVPIQPSQHDGPQTGPKGVLADYRHQKRKDNESKHGHQGKHSNKLHQQDSLTMQNTITGNDKKDEDAIDDEDEEKALRQYRKMRMQEMSAVAQKKQLQSSDPQFGFYKEINVSQYVSAIEDERQDVSVLIHLYQPYIPECMIVNQMLTTLAKRFGRAKFLRILSTEADPSFDPIALPALLAYRGGDLVCNIMCVTEGIEGVGRGEVDVETCEKLLLKHGALKESDRGVVQRRSSTLDSDDDLSF